MNLRNAWLQLSSCMLASAFVFGNSIKTVYEDVIFLFVVHPYDVGDAVSIGSTPEHYVVRTNPTVLNSILTHTSALIRIFCIRCTY